MVTATVTNEGEHQTVHLPKGIHLPTETVSVRQEGDAVVLEPIKTGKWSPGFFEAIRIDDPSFARPPQGELPPIRDL